MLSSFFLKEDSDGGHIIQLFRQLKEFTLRELFDFREEMLNRGSAGVMSRWVRSRSSLERRYAFRFSARWSRCRSCLS